MTHDRIPTESGPRELPTKLVVDGDGYCWQVWGDDLPGWSMARSNPDNKPVPEPWTYYVPERKAIAAAALTDSENPTVQALTEEVERLQAVKDAATKAVGIWRVTGRLSPGYIKDIAEALDGR